MFFTRRKFIQNPVIYKLATRFEQTAFQMKGYKDLIAHESKLMLFFSISVGKLKKMKIPANS